MTQTVLSRSWKEEFEFAASTARTERLRKERDKEAEREFSQREREKEIRAKEEREERELDQMVAAALATPEQVASFRVELDTYDARTVEALMRNQEALDAVRERIDDMLGQAHVMPDGRRVFRTRDGLRVFDERGQEVGNDEIDPAVIDRRNPVWEDFDAAQQERIRLQEERRQLHEYQQRLDEARERLDRGEITQPELDQMRGDLSATMPEAVRQRLGRDELPQQPGTEQQPAGVEAAALPDNMDALLRRSGPGPQLPSL